MSYVPSLAQVLTERLRQAIASAAPSCADTDPQLRRSDRADWQANGILALAKALKVNPRELAASVAQHATADPDAATDGFPATVAVSGPGFLNLTAADAAITHQIAARAADPRLGVPTLAAAGTTVIDYSQPNIAKEMHVGHLRSTVIGDSIVRLLEHGGQKVIRQNHLGDWGTQFGMLIQDLRERPEQLTGHASDGATAISRLNRLYRDARSRFESDPAFAERARQRVVALQAGDTDTLTTWHDIVTESKIYFETVYERLNVLLTDEDAIGESFYNAQLATVCTELEARGIAVRNNGALCVFFDDILGPDGKPTPLIIQKSDGGYGYATTDLAAIRHRVETLEATQILYVVDARQELHFRMVFETARRADWLPARTDVRHLAFGTVLAPDGTPFKTRAGDTVRLIELLDEAVSTARTVVADKSPHLPPDELDKRAHNVGIGAIKYADLSTSRTRDYVFDIERMVALNGNTGVYLQYAYARIQSILRKAADQTPTAHPELHLSIAERRLGLQLDNFADTLNHTLEHFEPHRLCTYLFDLAQTFTTFYETCPVLKADPATRDNRLLTCQLTRDTLHTGLQLLGITTPEQL